MKNLLLRKALIALCACASATPAVATSGAITLHGGITVPASVQWVMQSPAETAQRANVTVQSLSMAIKRSPEEALTYFASFAPSDAKLITVSYQ